MLPIQIEAEFIESNTSFIELIGQLKEAFFANEIKSPFLAEDQETSGYLDKKSEASSFMAKLSYWDI